MVILLGTVTVDGSPARPKGFRRSVKLSSRQEMRRWDAPCSGRFGGLARVSEGIPHVKLAAAATNFRIAHGSGVLAMDANRIGPGLGNVASVRLSQPVGGVRQVLAPGALARRAGFCFGALV